MRGIDRGTGGRARLRVTAVAVTVLIVGAACSLGHRTSAATHATRQQAGPVPSFASSPDPTPTPTVTPSPTVTPASVAAPAATPKPAVGAPGGSTAVAAGAAVRGVYRFSSEAWPAMTAAGFNAATDGGVNSLGQGELASGLRGMVWVPAYDNHSCRQTMSDAEVAQEVAQNASAGWRGLYYQVGDEPTANGCDAAGTYSHLTAVVHGADPSAKTWVADDQFNDMDIASWPAGVPMKGTVDVLAFDVYPCESGPCDYQMIDAAVQRIHQAGIPNWQFILQDFNAESWRWPTAAELQTQFQHWQHQGASGYWVFAWDYQNQAVQGQADNQAALQWINRQPV